MACPIQLSMPVDCADGLGGVKKLFLAVFPDNGLSYSPTVASGVITAWAGAAAKFFTYSVRQGIASGSGDSTTANTGSTFYTPTFKTQIEKITAAKNVELDNVIKNRLLTIVQLQDDTYWLMGYKNGMNVASMNVNPGVAMGDLNGYTLNGTGQEPSYWLQVSSSLIPTISA